MLNYAFFIGHTYGLPKNYEQYKATDIIGEGSIALLTILWIVTALASRPPGKVTRLLVLGLCCFMFSGLLDVLDEFFRYPNNHSGLSVIESIPAAIGMLVMSIALYLWHLEQLAVNRQLQRRELQYRAFEQIDAITQLYRADYWRERVIELQNKDQHGAIVVLDINDFANFNLTFGNHEGDRFLREMAHLILMHLRPVDLACRYAGDRFVLLLPDAGESYGVDLAQQIENSIKNVAFRANDNSTAVYQTVRTVIGNLGPDTNLQQLLASLNQSLDDKSEINAA